LRLAWAEGVPRSSPQIVALEDRLHELGYIVGDNYTLESINIIGHFERFPEVMRELVARKPDVIAAFGPEVTLKSALAATRTIPIVMVAIDYDPVALGYVASLAHPGGNATGVVMQRTDATPKQIQLVSEMFPDLCAATVFWSRDGADQWQVAQEAASAIGLRLYGVQFQGPPPYDYDRALDDVPSEARKALLLVGAAQFFIDRERIADFALQRGVASFHVERQNAVAGGLVSYGSSLIALLRHAADYIDRVARGAKPGDLPIEQPTKFDLVINLKTAKALGIEVPVPLLARADEVIE
jgi:putative ABC transport system substrate-binding protein